MEVQEDTIEVQEESVPKQWSNTTSDPTTVVQSPI